MDNITLQPNTVDLTVTPTNVEITTAPQTVDVTLQPNEVNLNLQPNELAVTLQPLELNLAIQTGNVTYNFGSSVSVVGEIPNGAIDGSNATFTTDYDFDPNTVLVFYNGLAQYNPTHYTTSGTTTITLNFSPSVGDIFTVNYDRA